MITEVGTEAACELLCHRKQTDQLMVLRGAIDLIVLQEGQLRRIRLREDEAAWVRIPPGVPHGAINLGRTPAVIVNAVLRHGPPRSPRLPAAASTRRPAQRLACHRDQAGILNAGPPCSWEGVKRSVSCRARASRGRGLLLGTVKAQPERQSSPGMNGTIAGVLAR